MKQLVFFFCCLSLQVSAQKQGNNWYFGDGAGVSFNSGSPVALLNGQLVYPGSSAHNEGCSAISDSSGALLLYTDGMTVWNRQHQVMQNGTGLLGNYSSTQSSIIVPDPANPDRWFYVFTISSGFCCGGNITDGLRYSRIDICADSSRGAIIATEKNIKLVDSVAEKIAVTRHANGTDYWVLTHQFGADEFWALHLSANGIVDTVITAIGSQHTGYVGGSQGQMKISPDGLHIALGASNGLDILDLFDFDPATGVVSNHQPLFKPNNDNVSVYGVEFSPDNSKLYARGLTSLGLMYAILFQYDLSVGNLAAINASLYVIDRDSFGLMLGPGLQLGPDGKIYTPSTNNGSTLGVIANPNVAGVGCTYQDQAVSLAGRIALYTLPTFIAGYDYSNERIKCEIIGIPETTFQQSLGVFPNPAAGAVTFNFANPDAQEFTLIITNLAGQTVREVTGLRGTSYQLPRENLAAGCYLFVLASANGQRATGKLLVE